jgi:hypothetical protein
MAKKNEKPVEGTNENQAPSTISRGKYTLNKVLGPDQNYRCGKTGISKLVKDFTEADFEKMKKAGNPNIIDTPSQS